MFSLNNTTRNTFLCNNLWKKTCSKTRQERRKFVCHIYQLNYTCVIQKARRRKSQSEQAPCRIPDRTVITALMAATHAAPRHASPPSRRCTGWTRTPNNSSVCRAKSARTGCRCTELSRLRHTSPLTRDSAWRTQPAGSKAARTKWWCTSGPPAIFRHAVCRPTWRSTTTRGPWHMDRCSELWFLLGRTVASNSTDIRYWGSSNGDANWRKKCIWI